MCLPFGMKKRPLGTLITILARPSDAEAVRGVRVSRNRTLGVHRREDQRIALERKRVPVKVATRLPNV